MAEAVTTWADQEYRAIGQSNGFEGGFERLEGRAAKQADELGVPFGDTDTYSHMADGILIGRSALDDKWYEV